MNLTIRHRRLRSFHALDSMVEDRLFALAALARIDDASVVLEHRVEESPAYRAEVHIAVPGPDLSVEAVDHTLANAFHRAVTELEGKLRERAEQRGRRSASHRKHEANFRIGRRSR
jgi:ribosome-associated translation inhibitor RaiA